MQDKYKKALDKIQELLKAEVLAHSDTRTRMLNQIRHLLIENAQLASELEDCRQSYLPVDKPKKDKYTVV